MTFKLKNLLKRNDVKIMVVDDEIAKEITRLSKKMNTPPSDVLLTALEILKMAFGREVSFRKPKSDVEIQMPLFKDFEPEINVEGENK